ncbi:MAG: efflux RND transporter permease subunit [Planctomycetota bacterium]
MITAAIRFAVRNPAISLVLALILVAFGVEAWRTKTVDAIPDISENQVVVVARWSGRSPQDVEDQITQPLAAGLASVRGVSEVRALSGFGFSQIYVVFEDRGHLLPRGDTADFYEGRTRVLEKLATLGELLPDGVVPELGPDATALGQIFMYTVDGPLDIATLRSLQDFVVRTELQAVPGVAEVATVGGKAREYQVDVDPDRMRRFGVDIVQVVSAIRRSNLDVGAKTLEEGGLETIIRGLGFIRGREDLESIVVGYATEDGFVAAGMAGGMQSMSMADAMRAPTEEGERPRDGLSDRPRPHRPVTVGDLAEVTLGPAFRRGALADARDELVGGVVAMRFGANPRAVIERVRQRVQAMNDPRSGILPDGVHIRPYYDRTQLTDETVRTLELALRDELFITAIVVLLFLLHVRSSFVVALTLPAGVLASFVLMDLLGVDSNLMSLTGIAIAIGTMVDMGIVMTENIHRALTEAPADADRETVIEEAAVEVGPALLTAVSTTVISFLPIFFLTEMEGKLFRPLAWTKSLALTMAALAGILLVPVLCRFLLVGRPGPKGRAAIIAVSVVLGALVGHFMSGTVGAVLGAVIVGALGWRAALEELISFDASPVSRFIARGYAPTLRWVLSHKAVFLGAIGLFVLTGALVGFGSRRLTAPLEGLADGALEETRLGAWLDATFPGLGQEFMPPLDEGSLLYMPSLLPQASLSQSLEVMKRQNAMMETVPEVARVVGKLGRAETALDPAPVGMIETVVILKPKSQWRPGVMKRDIVKELLAKTHTPGVLEGAGAWLQPIETRVLMLNSGIRAPMAIKLIGQPRDEDGASLSAGRAVDALERAADRIRAVLQGVPGVAGPNVENLGGKPYLEIEVDREKSGHWGVSTRDVQDAVALAVGGMPIDRTIEGRERYGVRVAWGRERRDEVESIERVRVRGALGREVPISEVASVRLTTGPAAIKTEDGRPRLHVTFAAAGRDEVSLMDAAMKRIAEWRAAIVARGDPDPIPPGVDLVPAGRYEGQIRARNRFAVLIPICIGLIFFLLYLQFRNWGVSLLVFSALPACVAGGVIMLAVFPDLKDLMFDLGLWDEPSTGPIYLTVAVIVGFIALAGIATDDGVVIATYLEQSFGKHRPENREEVREAVLQAGLRRIRPCLMTTFTTIIALYPILASTGRGSDVAQPMALPAIGGMLASLFSLFIVPTVYSWYRERELARGGEDASAAEAASPRHEGDVT